MWGKGSLQLEQLDGGKRFRLLTPIEFTGASGTVFVVPVGYVTDLASIPRLAQLIIPKLGKWNRAAVLHDALWQISRHHRKGMLVTIRDGDKPSIKHFTWPAVDRLGLAFPAAMLVDPVDVDGMFRRAMRLDDVGWAARWSMWAAVRIAAISQGRLGAMRLQTWGELIATIGCWLLPIAAFVAFITL